MPASGETKHREIPVSEWVVGAIGLVLVAAAVGFMLYSAFAEEKSPPDVLVRVDAIAQMREGYLVQFHVANRGGSTAKGVIVEGELTRQGESEETSQMTFDFVPAHSERRGGLFFSKDPRQFQLKARAFGYEAP